MISNIVSRSVRNAAAAMAMARTGAQARAASSASSSSSFSMITAEKKEGTGVALITLNRPKALNALCDQLIAELNESTAEFDKDPEVGCIVVTGSGDKAFAAGADIKEMADKEFAYAYKTNMFAQWAELNRIATPVVAAVNGYALGGGCAISIPIGATELVGVQTAASGSPEIQSVILGSVPYPRKHSA